MQNMALKETVTYVSLTSLSFRTSNKFQDIHTYIYINQQDLHVRFECISNRVFSAPSITPSSALNFSRVSSIKGFKVRHLMRNSGSPTSQNIFVQLLKAFFQFY